MIDPQDAAAVAALQRASYTKARGVKSSWPEADALDADAIAEWASALVELRPQTVFSYAASA